MLSTSTRSRVLSRNERNPGRLRQLLILLQIVVQDVELVIDLTDVLFKLAEFLLDDALLLIQLLLILLILLFLILAVVVWHDFV